MIVRCVLTTYPRRWTVLALISVGSWSSHAWPADVPAKTSDGRAVVLHDDERWDWAGTSDITATTVDGREVILYGDGRWGDARSPAPVAETRMDIVFVGDDSALRSGAANAMPVAAPAYLNAKFLPRDVALGDTCAWEVYAKQNANAIIVPTACEGAFVWGTRAARGGCVAVLPDPDSHEPVAQFVGDSVGGHYGSGSSYIASCTDWERPKAVPGVWVRPCSDINPAWSGQPWVLCTNGSFPVPTATIQRLRDDYASATGIPKSRTIEFETARVLEALAALGIEPQHAAEQDAVPPTLGAAPRMTRLAVADSALRYYLYFRDVEHCNPNRKVDPGTLGVFQEIASGFSRRFQGEVGRFDPEVRVFVPGATDAACLDQIKHRWEMHFY